MWVIRKKQVYPMGKRTLIALSIGNIHYVIRQQAMILRNFLSVKALNVFLGFIFLFTGILPLQATPADSYLYDTWTSRDGLPHNSINAITQTQDGYLWFATWEGIARFNGKEFKNFTRGAESGLADSGVRTLYADSDGGLLAGGARGGLIKRKPHDWQALTPIKNLINSVLRGPNGGLWVGIQGEGLIFRSHDNAESQIILEATSVYKLAICKNGDVLASTSQGLYRISSTETKKITQVSGLKNIPVYSAVEDPLGRIIVGSRKGVWIYEKGQLSRFHKQLNDVRVATILIDKQGGYWFGTFNQGAYHFSENELSSLTERDGLPHNNILAIYQDRENSIWIGTNDGLTRLRHAPFNTWNQAKGLKGNYIRTVLALDDGRIVVGGSNGLNVIKNKKIHSYTPTIGGNKAPKEISVLSLARGFDSGVWVGTSENGLFKLDNELLKHIELQGLPTQQIRAILEDQQGNLWIGTTGGLVKYSNDGAGQLFTTQNGLPDNYIMALTEDKKGQIWVGTGVGVSIIKENKAQTLDIQALEKAQYVFGFYAQKKYMWITTDRGLIRYRFADQNLAIIGQKQGLPLDKLFQVIPDTTGHFWLTSNRGIWRISRQEANAVADGIQSIINFEHYSELDGMPTSQLNGGSNPAANVDSSGQLWFASAKGVITTHPESIKQLVTAQFPTTIERIRADQKWLDLSKQEGIVLPAGNQRITFHFVGLGFISSDHIQYRTKLEGLESDWIKRGSRGVAEYTNLDPGSYRFLVNAYYPYHENEINNASFSFIIQPYWWQERVVQFGLLFIFVISIMLSVRWRLHLLRQSELKLKYEVAQKTQALQLQASAFERQAREDKLTGLHNRLAFDEWIKKIYSMSQITTTLSIVMLDIDHFKKINDTYTHLVGDKVLQRIGNRLLQLEQRNCFIARWGGEEFVLGVVDWEPNQVYALCEKIKFLVKDQDYKDVAEALAVTISIGIVNADTSADIEYLMRCADEELFKVKKGGRDGISVHTLAP
jgi:diguanylate cyclase (GGDEF)-like protein